MDRIGQVLLDRVGTRDSWEGGRPHSDQCSSRCNQGVEVGLLHSTVPVGTKAKGHVKVPS